MVYGALAPSAPSDEGAVSPIGETGGETISEVCHQFSPSVICSANATSLVRGRQGAAFAARQHTRQFDRPRAANPLRGLVPLRSTGISAPTTPQETFSRTSTCYLLPVTCYLFPPCAYPLKWACKFWRILGEKMLEILTIAPYNWARKIKEGQAMTVLCVKFIAVPSRGVSVCNP